MKKTFLAIFGLILLVFTTSSSLNRMKPAREFEKIVWLELDYNQDSVLFTPYSKAWREMWRYMEADIEIEGAPVMNYAKYTHAFDQRRENLYTLIHPQIINGTIQIYSPYDPMSFGLGVMDDGELRFPLNKNHGTNTFISSDSVRNNYAYYLGMFGPQSDIPMIDEYGEPMIFTDSISGYDMYMYPPRDYIWYEDVDIIKYRIRAKISYNKKGIEKKRTIESIAPIVYSREEGQIVGEQELFWVNYAEIKPLLKTGYYFNVFGKPITFYEHVELKLKNAIID